MSSLLTTSFAQQKSCLESILTRFSSDAKLTRIDDQLLHISLVQGCPIDFQYIDQLVECLKPIAKGWNKSGIFLKNKNLNNYSLFS